MNDDQMDEMLIQGVRDYNEPGATPREEMWSAIRAARDGRAAMGDGREKRIPRPSPIAHRLTRLAIAAALVLGVGIVIGRRMERTSPAALPTVSPVAVAPAPRDTVITQLREETAKTGQRVQELASAEPLADRNESNLAYKLVVLRHLAGSEAMISSFRTRARAGETDAEMAKWSRELLGTTRLLESSQAANDPVMKRLLDDLDLVISQIVQYTTKGTTNTDELDMIEQTINKRGVMNELRSTIPADTRRGT